MKIQDLLSNVFGTAVSAFSSGHNLYVLYDEEPDNFDILRTQVERRKNRMKDLRRMKITYYKVFA